MTPKPKPTKAQMIETIQQAVAKMEAPFEVKLTAKCTRDLMRPENRTYLERAHTWATYILTWRYPTMPSDDIRDDYKELMKAIEQMYMDRIITIE